ncbi:Homeobox protein tos8 [Binucleata daphniae]
MHIKITEDTIKTIAQYQYDYYVLETQDNHIYMALRDQLTILYKALNNIQCKNTRLCYLILARFLKKKLLFSIVKSREIYKLCTIEINQFNKYIEQMKSRQLEHNHNDILLNSKLAHVTKNTADTYNKKCKRANYPKQISKILKNWLRNNIQSPYPSEIEKAELAKLTGLDQTQINNWFINARRRILPMLKNNN